MRIEAWRWPCHCCAHFVDCWATAAACTAVPLIATQATTHSARFRTAGIAFQDSIFAAILRLYPTFWVLARRWSSRRCAKSFDGAPTAPGTATRPLVTSNPSTLPTLLCTTEPPTKNSSCTSPGRCRCQLVHTRRWSSIGGASCLNRATATPAASARVIPTIWPTTFATLCGTARMAS